MRIARCVLIPLAGRRRTMTARISRSQGSVLAISGAECRYDRTFAVGMRPPPDPAAASTIAERSDCVSPNRCLAL